MKHQSADRAWQIAVTERFGYCERCHITDGLAGHHYLPRRYGKTRHDVKNGVCLCHVCHQWAHAKPKLSGLFCEVTMLNRGDFNTAAQLREWARTSKCQIYRKRNAN